MRNKSLGEALTKKAWDRMGRTLADADEAKREEPSGTD
jgi:hypothetical protein